MFCGVAYGHGTNDFAMNQAVYLSRVAGNSGRNQCIRREWDWLRVALPIHMEGISRFTGRDEIRCPGRSVRIKSNLWSERKNVSEPGQGHGQDRD